MLPVLAWLKFTRSQLLRHSRAYVRQCVPRKAIALLLPSFKHSAVELPGRQCRVLHPGAWGSRCGDGLQAQCLFSGRGVSLFHLTSGPWH